MDEKLCNEENFLKRKWFLRNGQDTHEEGKYERPVMFLVVEKTDRKNVQFGPIIQAAITPFTVGKGKKKTVHEALCFLCLCGEGFVSVIVNYDNYDMEITLHFSDDMLLKEFVQVIEKGEWCNTWFQGFVSGCEDILLPRVQAQYEKLTGTPWKNPLRLKLKSQVPFSQSSTPTSSAARGSVGQEADQGPGVGMEPIAIEVPAPLALPAPPLPTSQEVVPAVPASTTRQQPSTSSGGGSRDTTAVAQEVRRLRTRL